MTLSEGMEMVKDNFMFSYIVVSGSILKWVKKNSALNVRFSCLIKGLVIKWENIFINTGWRHES